MTVLSEEVLVYLVGHITLFALATPGVPPPKTYSPSAVLKQHVPDSDDET